MKVAVVWSSPNVDGLTASAKNQVIAGGTGRGTLECLQHMELAGETYADCLANGFNMYY